MSRHTMTDERKTNPQDKGQPMKNTIRLAVLAWAARTLHTLGSPPVASTGELVRRFVWLDFAFSLAGYTMFGVGYIGYMTFAVALLRAQGASGSAASRARQSVRVRCMVGRVQSSRSTARTGEASAWLSFRGRAISS